MSEYRLIRSDRKTVALEVTRDGEVIVRAPRRMAQAKIDEFVASHAQWLRDALSRQQARAAAHPEPDAAEEARLRRLAKEILPARTAFYAEQMGLHPTSVRITSARTRFGSCSAKNSICYSWRLMQYPPEAIDYVVVHELSHIIHKNHGREFYACIARVLPDYQKRRALLRA
jgi:predicted metal-dependent hydrolase